MHLTLIVNVALSCETGVARGLDNGIFRGVLPSTVANNRARVLDSPFRVSGLKADPLSNRASIVQ